MVILYQEKTTHGDDWDTGLVEDILKKYHHERVSDYPPMHPVDILSIATKRDPIPVKDLTGLKDVTNERGHYLGSHDIVTALKQDTFKCKFG